MSEGRLSLSDGRQLAWCEYGLPDGVPILRFQGMPGSRFSRYPHEGAYELLGVRMIVSDRPGYGASERLQGRGVSAVANDAAELLDHLGIASVHVIGQSGGGPHALAFAALHPNRVRAATVVVGMAPVEQDEVDELIGLNRAGWYAARNGWKAMFDLLAPVRQDLIRDPLAAFLGVMDTAPASDREVINDPVWQRVMAEDVREALRPGAEGWTDESMAVFTSWDFDPSSVRSSLTWWHGEHDANAPITSTRRLVSRIPGANLHVWTEAGHLESYRRHDEILAELLPR